LLTFSRDGATGWSRPEFHDQLIEPICMAGMIALRTAGKEVLVFANPDNLERAAGPPKPGRPRDRKNLTIQLSHDGGSSWKAKRTLEPGYSGYSDLAALPDGTVLCLYERGGLGDNYFRTAFLTLARFDLEWVTSQ
jgi:sialidase-1